MDRAGVEDVTAFPAESFATACMSVTYLASESFNRSIMSDICFTVIAVRATLDNCPVWGSTATNVSTATGASCRRAT